jgi:hypothetical protein
MPPILSEMSRIFGFGRGGRIERPFVGVAATRSNVV